MWSRGTECSNRHNDGCCSRTRKADSHHYRSRLRRGRGREGAPEMSRAGAQNHRGRTHRSSLDHLEREWVKVAGAAVLNLPPGESDTARFSIDAIERCSTTERRWTRREVAILMRRNNSAALKKLMYQIVIPCVTVPGSHIPNALKVRITNEISALTRPSQ